MPLLTSIRPTPGARNIFGPRASDYAARLDDGLTVLTCDGSESSSALTRARDLFESNTPFYNALLLPDAHAEFARSAAARILEQLTGEDERRHAFDAVRTGLLLMNGTAIGQLQLLRPSEITALRALVQYGESMLFRSQTERSRCSETLNVSCERVFLTPFLDAGIPSVVRRPNSSGVVVWAPHESARMLSIYAYACWYLREPVTFVCNGQLPDTPHIYVPASQAEGALQRAGIIIDADLYDPGSALAFAGRGFGLATARSSGAHEYLLGSVTYEPNDHSSILKALSRARCESAVALGADARRRALLHDFQAQPTPLASRSNVVKRNKMD